MAGTYLENPIIVFIGEYVEVKNARGVPLWKGWVEKVEEQSPFDDYVMWMWDDKGQLHSYIIYPDVDIICVTRA
jgi:hypothetical protein